MSKTDLATQSAFEIAPLMEGGDEIARILMEDMSGLGPVNLPRVKMPSGATPVFTITRGKDDDDPEVAKSLDAIIIRQHPAYAYWSNPNSMDGTRPDCASMDGIMGTMSPELGGECLSCADCPHNQFGTEIRPSGEQGRGKACKNGHRLYLLRSGDYLPATMTIPPTGLRAYKTYLQTLILPRDTRAPRLRFYMVVTHIELKQAKSADSTAYYTPTFSLKQALEPDVAIALKAYADAFSKSMDSAQIDADTVF